MSLTEAQKRAAKKWQTEKVDEIKLRVPKGEKAIIQDYASSRGETVNGFIRRSIEETMERDREEIKK